jgi:hypothetical protein
MTRMPGLLRGPEEIERTANGPRVVDVLFYEWFFVSTGRYVYGYASSLNGT